MIAYLLGPFLQQYYYEVIIGSIFLAPFTPLLMHTLSFIVLSILSLPLILPQLALVMGTSILSVIGPLTLFTALIGASYFLGFAFNKNLNLIDYIINGGLLQIATALQGVAME